MLKRVLLIGLALVLALSLLIGCNPRKALTAAEFTNLVEKAGYRIYNVTETFETENIKAAIQAVEPEDRFAIEFYVFATSEMAITMFNEIRNGLNAPSGTWYSKVEVNAANYNIYRGTFNGVFYATARIDNTLLYVETEDTNKAAVDEMLKTLGYR